MRNLFFGLLVANLLFFAWGRWIAPEPEAATPVVTPGVKLAGEAQPAKVSAPLRCYSVGPYPDETTTRHVEEVLGTRGLRAVARKVEGTATIFWVYVPAASTQSEQRRQLRALDGAGIKDAEVLTQPEFAGRISLGQYPDQAAAQVRAAAASQVGLPVQVENREQPRDDWWLDVSLPVSAPVLQADDAEIASGAALQIAPCAAPS